MSAVSALIAHHIVVGQHFIASEGFPHPVRAGNLGCPEGRTARGTVWR